MNTFVEITDWTSFKQIVARKDLRVQFKEDNDTYDIYVYDGLLWRIILSKGTAEATDFEDNYKDDANYKILQSNILTDGTNVAQIDSSGRLFITDQTPEGPDRTTVREGGQTQVAGRDGVDTFNWVIPNGETFHLTKFDFDGYIMTEGTIIQLKSELIYQPNGNTTGEELISVIYLQSQSSGSKNITLEFVGDGTRRIQIKTTNITKDVAEVARYFGGYY